MTRNGIEPAMGNMFHVGPPGDTDILSRSSISNAVMTSYLQVHDVMPSGSRSSVSHDHLSYVMVVGVAKERRSGGGYHRIFAPVRFHMWMNHTPLVDYYDMELVA